MSPPPDDNVNVVVRCRPLSSDELAQGCTSVAEVDEISRKISIGNPSVPGELPKEFTFDSVFAPNAKQVNVYTQAARPIVHNVLEGYNGTIFAYGQTGTGKTFTMEGNRAIPELKGIIPNSFAHIFGHIAHCGDERKFLVRVAYLEIYNEEIRDLLGKDQSAKLELKERPDIGVYVKDLTNVTVGSADEMDRIMTVGNKNRSVGATKMNEFSSRSHAIFTVTVECSELGVDKSYHVRVGKLHLVDLAGSERQAKTGATGQRLKEATKINLSLSTLGNVISALVDAKATHVPYRNSKLTRMLQDSLGGNSKTVMIANVGPADYNYDETISTLRYANRAKNIKNQAKINEDPKDALLRKFQQEIEELRKQLAEGGSGEEDEGEEPEQGAGPEPGEKKAKKKGGGMGDEALRELEKEIAEQKAKLEGEMGDDDRATLSETLLLKEELLEKAREEHEQLAKKLEQLEKKIIVGGENLLEKADIQERLLEEARVELEQRQAKEAQLRLALEQKQAERIDLEEKYSSLQEEAAGKSKKLKKVWTMLQSAKSELSDIQTEQQRETEELLDNVRQLSRELSLHHLIIDEFVPKQQQDLIQQNCHWNEEIGDWQLKCVAYTGNNIRSRDPADDIPSAGPVDYHFSPDFSRVYLSYAEDAGANINPTSSSKQRKMKSDRKKAQLRALLK